MCKSDVFEPGNRLILDEEPSFLYAVRRELAILGFVAVLGPVYEYVSDRKLVAG